MKNLNTFEQMFESNADKYKVKFKRWNCVLDFGQYNNDRTAIELNDARTGEPVLVATVNIPEEPLQKDEIIIKDWSENEGILEILQTAGIVGPVLREVSTGFVKAKVVKLLVEPK